MPASNYITVVSRAVSALFSDMISVIKYVGRVACPGTAPQNCVRSVEAQRASQNPLISFSSSDSLEENINGPSVIRVPEWLPSPLGRYYMYFAHHEGQYIRLAYANKLEGPWTIHEPGTLQLAQCNIFCRHIASPDVIVDASAKEIVMYFHGVLRGGHRQATDVAVSVDGINFIPHNTNIGSSYFQAFSHQGNVYAIDGKGGLNRAENWLGLWDRRKEPLIKPSFLSGWLRTRKLRVRHSGLYEDVNILYLFYTLKRDAPERIYLSTVNLDGDWTEWQLSYPIEVLRPEAGYEGVDYPIFPSRPGKAIHVQQLRDPGIIEDNGELYMFYSVAGEMGIAMAKLQLNRVGVAD